jgi:hypothetical protein
MGRRLFIPKLSVSSFKMGGFFIKESVSNFQNRLFKKTFLSGKNPVIK